MSILNLTNDVVQENCARFFVLIHSIQLRLRGMVLPSTLQVCVAGGAIRDAFLSRVPKDIDVFLLGGIVNNKCFVKYQDFNHLFDDVPNVKISHGITSEEQYANGFIVLANMKIPSLVGDIPIQIIAHTATTETELLQSFDWNICQLCYNATKTLYYHESLNPLVRNNDWTNTLDTLKLNPLYQGNAKKTLARGFIFENRYNLYMQDLDIHELCFRIIDIIDNDFCPEKIVLKTVMEEINARP